ncbi:MAG: hypothetical protein ACRDP4_05645 [Nocardioidaceae bacterium]
MTYRIVGEEFMDGAWIEFATLKCDLCAKGYPNDLASDSGEIAMAPLEGWTRWPYRNGPYDVCRECRASFTDALQEEIL